MQKRRNGLNKSSGRKKQPLKRRPREKNRKLHRNAKKIVRESWHLLVRYNAAL